MSESNEDSLPKSSGFGGLGAALATLAEGIKGNPYLAAIVAIVIVVGLVLIFVESAIKIGAITVVAFIAISFVGFTLYDGVRRQKMQIRALASKRLSLTTDTVNFLNQLSMSQKDKIRKVLRGAATDIAAALKLSPDLTRSNVFGVENDENYMRILPELTWNINSDDEKTIRMRVGEGSTGRCFQSRKPNVAIFRRGWGKDDIKDEERRKVDPNLQWIISVPIWAGANQDKPIGVLNVDGLRERRDEEELRVALGRLFNWSEVISLIIAQGATD